MEHNNTVQKNIEVKIARIRAGLTQEQLRKVIKMSPKKLVAIERGNYDILTFKNMRDISKALGVSMQELFFSKENKDSRLID